MKRLVFYFDVVSPYAWIAFERLPQVMQGCSHEVEYRPVLLAGLLQRSGQRGPAEIAPKRAWTYRHVGWLAQHHGVVLDLPAVHPFNPLPLLRLALACGPNRRVVEALFRHVWCGGGDAADADRLAVLQRQLAPTRDPAGDDIKQALRAATDAAAGDGVFGVPTVSMDGRLFFGVDALPMLRDAVDGGAWFESPAWDAAAAPRPGVVRRGTRGPGPQPG